MARVHLVLTKDGASLAAARAAVEKAGGTVLKQNADIGTLTVRAPATGFVTKVSARTTRPTARRRRPSSVRSSPR